MGNVITIASIQMFVHKGKKENLVEVKNNLQHINKLYPQIKMVILPELSITNIGGDINEQAEEIPGSLTRFFSTLAKKHGIWLIPGTMYERAGDKIFNTAVVFSPKGELVGKYRKRYPWCPYEKTDSGTKPFVFNIEGIGSVGIMICYDLWFPEVARDLISLGAELILVPTMTTTGDRSQEQILSKATAIVQQCYLVSCNGVGYGGVGGSVIIDPEGNTLQESGSGPFIQTSVIDFNRVRILREKGVCGVTRPLKDFNENQQSFMVYNKKSRD